MTAYSVEAGPKVKILSTPGFAREAEAHGFGVMSRLAITRLLLRVGVGGPSWVCGDPELRRSTMEDEGRTLRIKAQFRFWAIRDDHEAECDCGCDGQKVITFLLPEEY